MEKNLIELGNNYRTKCGYETQIYHVFDETEIPDKYLIHGAIKSFDNVWIPTKWTIDGIDVKNYGPHDLSLQLPIATIGLPNNYFLTEYACEFIDYQKKPLKIFVDLDGVFADCHGHFRTQFGINDPSTLSPKEFWKLAGSVKNFFYHLPKLPNARLLLKFLRSVPAHELSILTGTPIPRGNLVTSEADKVRWVYKYLSSSIPVYTLCGGVNKYKFIDPTYDCLLIDDMSRNVDKWIEHGGLGIVHEDVYSTIEQVVKILNLDKKMLDILTDVV